jgi:hypothetical protein
MQDQKALALFHETLAKTQEGRIPWEPSVSGDILIAAIKGKYSLLLSREDSDNWALASVTLTMKDQLDREILTVNRYSDGVDQSDLRNLYDTARRQAYKVDQQVDDLISDLKSL